MSIASLIPLLSALAATGVADLNPTQLDSATVSYRSVPREYQLDGVVEAVQQTTVSAQTQGQVQEIFFDVDDFV
ncbi:MAG: efflux transporter periplasmic adaptor subunit, partial [Chromatiaceae bacterium]